MNSEDIKLLLEMKEYILSVKEYIDILYTSPQIYRMETDEYGRQILYTDDNYKFLFAVDVNKKEEKDLDEPNKKAL